MTCEHCAKHAQADDESVGEADNLRFARIVLSMLNGAADAVILAVEEVQGCHSCMARLLGAAAGMCTGQMMMLGAVEVESYLRENPPPTPLSEEDKWEEIHRCAIAAMEHTVADIADLEAGPPEQ
ncbi:hypothetical protein ACXYX3_11365 [Mycobacterium sp. C3-094]